MVTELGLSGERLLLFALLYGFSQGGDGYSGKQDYLMDWLGCSRRSILNYTTELKAKGCLVETTSPTGQRILRAVRKSCANIAHDAQNFPTECANSAHGDAQIFPTECANFAHSTIYNNTDNTIYNYSCSRAPETTTPPTAEEVAAYCRERGNDIDARRFVDYYAVSGWKRGGKPIEDWRALIRLWEQNGRANKAAPVTETSAAGNGTNGEAAKNSFDTDDFWAAALKKSYGG